METDQVHPPSRVPGHSKCKQCSISEAPERVGQVDEVLSVVVSDTDVVEDTRKEVSRGA